MMNRTLARRKGVQRTNKVSEATKDYFMKLILKTGRCASTSIMQSTAVRSNMEKKKSC